ncbi:iron-sulfur cluster carrier protein ApbC [Simiduia aestuariiviva]|uniref:Iron-sulfur cluster carrier protein n=1 Tax=Simiduia aestuariiviva TaxID=1510459 RepID=A0A839UM01_9GAMM|nr:iron-sulfur cluster carrier protein ApbC [Simiduia aestuariiviva]MBB3167590.1 ATP-binding protein involved in chromosome partitioning [Simiduia aestuariiviva]
MNSPDRDAIYQALAFVKDPCTGRSLTALDAVTGIEISDNDINVHLVLGYPALSLKSQIEESVCIAVSTVEGVASVTTDLGWLIKPKATANQKEPLPNVANIIAVASGKGGVGKSTTTTNLALALAAEGAKVGVLDADIYGPSQPQMFGVGNVRPQIRGQKHMEPIEAYGIQLNSMGFLVTEQTPMIWRGPMVSGALQQLLSLTLWHDLDYLLIDMPPGTGDIQLTLAQSVPVTGAVIVTTPQDIALLDAKKGIEMFRKVSVPVLGVVENMATHVCSECGHEEHIFGEGGGARIAVDYQTQCLGSLPLTLSIREQMDRGQPTLVAEPESEVSDTYRRIARQMAANLWLAEGAQVPAIEIDDD